jgi:hypothetical protein
MIESLIAFLGGNAFRMLFGEISSAWTKHQDHRHELAMMRLQADVEAQRHGQQVEMTRLQTEAQVSVVRVQGEADIARGETDAFVEAVRATSRSSGVAWVDAWNGAIRPGLATMAGLLIAAHFARSGFALDETGWALVSAIIGVYIADRSLAKRGK